MISGKWEGVRCYWMVLLHSSYVVCSSNPSSAVISFSGYAFHSSSDVVFPFIDQGGSDGPVCVVWASPSRWDHNVVRAQR